MATIFTRQNTLDSKARTERQARAGRAFSISRTIAAMTGEASRLDGYEKEVLQEIGRANGRGYDPQRMPIPLALLADPTAHPDYLVRDMSVGTPSTGGYMVGTATAPVVDILRPWSVAARAGVTLLPLSSQGFSNISVDIPTVTSPTAGYWLTNETTAITPSDPTLDKITLRAKTGGVLTKFSRQLARQTGDLSDALLQREFLGTLGRLLDVAILSGTGADGQPRGIANTAGIATATGAFDWDDALAMEQTAATQGADDQHIGYVTTPAVRRLLKQKTLLTGDGAELLWKSSPSGDLIAGRAGYVASYAPTDTMIAGPWNDLLLAIWGTPFIEIDPRDPVGFKVGTVQARMMVDCDVALRTPAAWTVHSSIV